MLYRLAVTSVLYPKVILEHYYDYSVCLSLQSMVFQRVCPE